MKQTLIEPVSIDEFRAPQNFPVINTEYMGHYTTPTLDVFGIETIEKPPEGVLFSLLSVSNLERLEEMLTVSREREVPVVGYLKCYGMQGKYGPPFYALRVALPQENGDSTIEVLTPELAQKVIGRYSLPEDLFV